jgi:hypothetical protein
MQTVWLKRKTAFVVGESHSLHRSLSRGCSHDSEPEEMRQRLSEVTQMAAPCVRHL